MHAGSSDGVRAPPARPPKMLRAHKVLPHPQDEVSSAGSSPKSAGGERLTDKASSRTSPPQSPTITKSSMTPTGAPTLPPTPPSNSNETLEGVENSVVVEQVDDQSGSLLSRKPSGGTPTNQRSPPTPDVTPPRIRPGVGVLLQRPSASDNYTSSRNDSFETARENQWSSDEEPAQMHTRNWLDATRETRLASIGLGLGLESDGDRTPTKEIHPVMQETRNFATFDGAWEKPERQASKLSESEWDQDLMRHVTVRKRSKRETGPRTEEKTISSGKGISPELLRSASLRDRVERQQEKPPTPSMEDFAQQIQWPSSFGDFAKRLDFENRRASGASGTSAVVEAMVVDAFPQRRRTLRHTSKNVDLRSRGTSPDRSNRNSTSSTGRTSISAGQIPRLVHKKDRIPDRSNRSSLISELSMAPTTSSGSGQKIESISVVVVPQRRSSLRSNSNSRRPSAATSKSSQSPQRSRPVTAPEQQSQGFDLPTDKYRVVSDPNPTIFPEEIRRGRDQRPSIPVRSSSLSAPTSRSGSRAPSVASDQRKSRSLSRDAESRAKSIERNSLEQQHPIASSVGSTIGDDYPHRRLSVPPGHSLRLSNASTPSEALELSQARAVNFYPHHNESLVVVQQPARPKTEGPKPVTDQGTGAEISNVSAVANSEPSTPPPKKNVAPLVESHLKNPRPPPSPPKFQIIPPTPASELENPTGQDSMRWTRSQKSRSVGPITLVRRALSTSSRRRSNSQDGPPDHTSGVPYRRATVSHSQTPANLHPTWQARRNFFADLESNDSDSEMGNDWLIGRNLADAEARRTTVLRPTRRGSFISAFSPSTSISTMKPKTNNYPRLRDGDLIVRPISPATSITRVTKRPPHQHGVPRVHTISGLGLQIEFLGLRGLQEKLRVRRERAEMQRRERNRERLRQSIGVRIVQPDAKIF